MEGMPRIAAYPDPSDPSDARSCLADLEYARTVENVACHRKILAAMELWEHRMIAAADRGADAVLAGNDTFSEISARLHCSHTTARGYVEAAALLLRMPILGGSVARGEIDYAKLRMTTTVFGDDASPRTLSLLEEQVACAAAEFTPSALRAQLWKLWLAADPDEAAEACRRRASTDRRAYIRRGGHGLSWLTACVTDAEGSQADALLCEITATVCSNDPRSKSALRADGLMALLHGEAALVCGCGQADCPKGTQPAPSRRKPLVEVVVDAETLLGLADNPATLPDGAPVDAEVARALAQDATWRAIITDTRDALARSTIAGEGVDETASNAASSGVGNADRTSANGSPALPAMELAAAQGSEICCATTGIDARSVAPVEREAPSAPARANGTYAALAAALDDIELRFGTGDSVEREPLPSPPSRNILARGSVRRSGAIPARACGRARSRDAVTVSGAAELIEAWADAIAAGPDETGADTIGHGELRDPPPGALVYQPRADVAAIVRAQYTTCAFPDCAVPSRRCELDHVVAFDHDDPVRGGWTIPANLQPLCKRHHDIKSHRYWTCSTLRGGAHHWRHHSGLERITVPCNGFAVGATQQPQSALALAPSYSDVLTPAESLDLLYEPTWWERNMGSYEHPGNDRYLVAHYREHQAIVHRRMALQPAPF